MKEEQIIESLKALGADIDGAMERLLDDKALYVQCVEMLSSDENFDELEQGINTGDLSMAYEAAHALKGVSANLGLTSLYTAVCNLVEPLREKKKANYNELYNEVDQCREKIKMVLE